MESALVPYSASDYLPAQAVLVIAPHPDDEVFGCGGAILSHRAQGVVVHVVVLTDGSGAGDTQARYTESRAAAQVLGYGEPEFWGLPDRSLGYSDALVDRLCAAMNASGCDLVYAPSPWEIHPDHRQTSVLAIQAVRRSSHTVRIAFYEVGGPLRPNLLLDISPHVATKTLAMRCFVSQLERQDYLGHIQGLNRYRTYTLSSAIEAAEAYCLLDRNALEKCVREGAFGAGSLVALEHAAIGMPSQRPLVSVLIRSMDRPELAQALNSVALQTYPCAEVVVVSACASHQPLPDFCGAYPLRLISSEEALPRSKAANCALNAARGEYCLFLDDDDWLMPGHVSRLVDTLERQPNAHAAYTGVSLVDQQGQIAGQAFDLPFDDIRLLAGNLTPIHAVMFRTSLAHTGCKFDESLDRYEDWDFWLQIAQRGALTHLPGVSAVYRIHPSSGVHEDSGPLGTAAQQIYQKWNPLWTPYQWGQIMRRVWSHAELEVQWHESQRALEKAQAELGRCAPQLQVQMDLVARQSRQLGELSDGLMHQTATVKVQSDTIVALGETIRQQTNVVGGQASTIAKQLTDLEREHAALLYAHDEIRLMKNSLSWQLTRPLRWLGRAWRHMFGRT